MNQYMRKFMKKIVCAVCALGIAAGVLVPVQAKEKSSFWLSGTSFDVEGGRLGIYYEKEDAILLKGRVKKSVSKNRLNQADERKIKSVISISDTCRIVFEEEDGSMTAGLYKEWIKDGGGGDYQEGDRMGFCTVLIKVKNNKAVKIIFLN